MIIQKYYEPSDTYENYDTETGEWTNNYGQTFRDPNEYLEDDEDGYTPFGDE